MFRSYTLALLALSFSGTALAGTPFTATLDTPVEKQTRIVAENALWSCVEKSCTATLKRKTVKLSTCKKVAKEIGKLTAFANEKASLSEEDLIRCNAVAKS